MATLTGLIGVESYTCGQGCVNGGLFACDNADDEEADVRSRSYIDGARGEEDKKEYAGSLKVDRADLRRVRIYK